MFRPLKLLLATVFVLGLLAPTAWALSNAHFVGTPTITRTDDTLLVTGKVAGLGNVPEIHVDVNATAECINGGSQHPKAANKEAVSGGGNFPVQNGKADFSVETNEPSIAPSCTPPMTLVFVDVSITVSIDTNGDGVPDTVILTQNFSGTF